MSNSELEEALALQIRALELPIPDPQFQAIPTRRFRWDFAWPDQKLLVEVNGGVWVKSGHSSGGGISRDYEKNNLANLAGYRCLIFTGAMIESGEAVDMIAKALGVEE